MVEKKEGATMTCKNCDVDLICRMKEYKGDFAPKLQWQNFDGSAHYHTKDGKNFTCNVPDDDKVSSPSAKTPGDDPQTKFTSLTNDEMLSRIYEMVGEIFRDLIDKKIKGEK